MGSLVLSSCLTVPSSLTTNTLSLCTTLQHRKLDFLPLSLLTVDLSFSETLQTNLKADPRSLPESRTFSSSLAHRTPLPDSHTVSFQAILRARINVRFIYQFKMKVSAILLLAVMVFHANALLDSQSTSQDVKQTGGEGGNGGDNTQTGGNGGNGPSSVRESIPPRFTPLMFLIYVLGHQLTSHFTVWWEGW